MDQRGTGRGYRGGSRGHSSDRGGGSRGGGGRGGYNRDRGDRDSHHHHGHRDNDNRGGDREGKTHERPKKEAILDLGKYMDKQICVKFSGGREVVGLLKGYDQLMNLVLDEVKETIRGILITFPPFWGILLFPASSFLCFDFVESQTFFTLGW